MRRTYSLVRLATALMDAPDERHWGYQLSKTSGVRSGVMYPLLTRLLEAGWLNDGWEELSDQKRPPRRYYTLTNEGWDQLRSVLTQARTDPRFTQPILKGA